MKVLDIQAVSKSYSAGQRVLSDFDLQVGENEILAILGPSGTGKSTLLRCIAGLESPESGVIKLAGRVVYDRQTNRSPSQRNIGFMFQDYALFPHLTVRQNVAFGLSNVSKAMRADRTQKYMSLCTISELADRYPHQLSGGQQQRVALARALAPEPDLVLLDEPFSNLDEQLKKEMRGEISSVLKHCNVSAVMVVHDVQDAFAIADKICVIDEGRNIQTAAPNELFKNPNSEPSARISGTVNILPATLEQGALTTPLGRLPHKGSMPAGKAKIVVRPSMIQCTAASDGEWRVDEVLFSGPENLLRCSKGIQSILVSDASQCIAAGQLLKVKVVEGGYSVIGD